MLDDDIVLGHKKMVNTRKHQNRFMKWVLFTAILFFSG